MELGLTVMTLDELIKITNVYHTVFETAIGRDAKIKAFQKFELCCAEFNLRAVACARSFAG